MDNFGIVRQSLVLTSVVSLSLEGPEWTAYLEGIQKEKKKKARGEERRKRDGLQGSAGKESYSFPIIPVVRIIVRRVVGLESTSIRWIRGHQRVRVFSVNRVFRHFAAVIGRVFGPVPGS